ncbi:hypothetical protein [Microvirga arabica]|uniref:hypothetical protein n=1 Tax=Microvirga arabica TaxID=1128671 RepID=UPI00193AC170|nr:hypothetical protein [Microvirga arabica]MBM1172811.1 hypothetical protein [Microvirga arabica]
MAEAISAAEQDTMLSQSTLALIIALAFSGMHVFGKSMVFLRTTPRSAWLSIAGGVSVAYVFGHLLPELAAHQETFRRETEENRGFLSGLESHTYLIALLGLAVLYGLDRLARTSARNEERAGRDKRPSRGAFWLHLGSFAIYNMLIGYLLLHREETDVRSLIIYGIAMRLHFVVNDQGLREHHGRTYDREGRWILAVAPLLGWGIGLMTELPLLAIGSLFAFLAGGVVLNVLKEELPEDRESRFSAFALGTGAYAALLLTSH